MAYINLYDFLKTQKKHGDKYKKTETKVMT